MTESTSTWEPGSTPLKWPIARDRLTDLPLPIWALAGVAAVFVWATLAGTSAPQAGNPTLLKLRSEVSTLTGQVSDLHSELELKNLELQRLQQIHAYSASFGIPADLSTMIYDIALAEGLDPELGFRLVRVESSFRRNVVSPKGAIGYTQVLPTTAQWLDPSVETKDLFDTQTNLHMGFRYLHFLLGEYEGDMRLALLAYNRGPSRVHGLLSDGIDPSNGYAKAVLGE